MLKATKLHRFFLYLAVLAVLVSAAFWLQQLKIFVDRDSAQRQILLSINSGFKWFAKATNPQTGMLNYVYYPDSGAYSNKNDSHVRRLASTWAASELALFLNRSDIDSMIKKTLDIYLVGPRKNIAYNAFLVMTLLNKKDYPNRQELMKTLAGEILSRQNMDGSFETSGIDYYPGEALLALMRLYNETNNEEYLAAVQKAFPFYRNYWRQNNNTAFVPWHTQAYKLLYEKTGKKEVADFIFEMNDWLLARDGFSEKIHISLAVHLEGISDAYVVAKQINDAIREQKYGASIKSATARILKLQLFPYGGFMNSLENNSMRNDYTQHATLALKKVYQNEIFK